MKYADYTEEELILDESFQNWVRQEKAEDILFWNQWVSNHPEHRSKIENARFMLLGLGFSEMSLPEKEVSHAWAELQEAIRLREKPAQKMAKRPINQLVKGWCKTAATLIIIFICGAIYWLNGDNVITYYTDFGKTATISLPDGSQVILNGNTTLKYNANWRPNSAREVWLDGEAFFAVTKKNNRVNAKFIVHIPDMHIEVLGTKFNVYRRKHKSRIVLNCGQVKLNIKNPTQPASLLMKPGDLIELAQHSTKLVKRKVNPDVYSSWKNNQLIFDSTPLAEIGEMIETTYGKKVVFLDASQSERKLTGTIPTDNLDILIMTLSKSFNLSITKNANQLMIKPN